MKHIRRLVFENGNLVEHIADVVIMIQTGFISYALRIGGYHDRRAIVTR